MSSHESISAKVQHGHFRQHGNVKAICGNDSCPWKHVARTLGTVNRKAAEHVRETGHEVWVDRYMTKLVRPAP